MKQWKIVSLIMKWRKTYFLIGIGVLLVIVAIGTYVWSEPELEPWEQAAVAFWDAAGVHQDIGEAKKWVAPGNLIHLSDFRASGEPPDKPGTVWVTWTPGRTPDEKIVWILYDPKNLPPYRDNLRFTTVRKVNGQWLVYLVFFDDRDDHKDVESFLKETEAEGVKWKEVTME